MTIRDLSAALPLIEQTAPLLQTRHFGRMMRGSERVTSTNTLAGQWAAAGAAEGSVVIAEHQTAGRGRQGRTWTASSGLNLLFSVVLHPALAPERLGLVTLAAGVAVAEAIEGFTAPVLPALKWPNDVLFEGRKCCGMLLESTFSGHTAARPGFVILGIGINVNQDAFPAGLQATSLLLETGRTVPRAPLLASLLLHLEQRYESLLADGGASVRRAYTTRLYGLQKPWTLRLTGSDRHVSGILTGITETGALRLQTETGLQTFHAGEITTSA